MLRTIITAGDIQLGSADAGSPSWSVLLRLCTNANHWRNYCTESRRQIVNTAWPGLDVAFDSANAGHYNCRRLRSSVCHPPTWRSGPGMHMCHFVLSYNATLKNLAFWFDFHVTFGILRKFTWHQIHAVWRGRSCPFEKKPAVICINSTPTQTTVCGWRLLAWEKFVYQQQELDSWRQLWLAAWEYLSSFVFI